MILQANGNQKKVAVAIVISDKLEFKPKKITNEKDVHYIMIKWTIQED